MSKVYFGRHPGENENHELSRIPEPQMEVAWPKRDLLMVNLSIYSSSQEPTVVDIRLYAAYFDGCREPPPIETQVGIAAIQGTRVFFGGQVIPDRSMYCGGVWTSGATALKVPQGTEHVLLLAKIDKPGERCELSFVDMLRNPHLVLWSSDSSKLRKLPC